MSGPSTTAERYRAVVGCGSIGWRHIEGYQLSDEVDVVAVVEVLTAASI